MMSDEISIEVSYAVPGTQRVLALRVPRDCLARRAVELSCMAALFPEIDVANCPLGVFGTQVEDDYPLAEGDRLEIYRPLENDPMEARRRAAEGEMREGRVSRARRPRSGGTPSFPGGRPRSRVSRAGRPRSQGDALVPRGGRRRCWLVVRDGCDVD